MQMGNTGRSPELTLLDCTLRDGGYYNGWCFSSSLVEKYLAVMAGTGVDVVEIGFRSRKTDEFYGPYAYSSDRWLTSLPIPAGVQLAVMCNAKELLEVGNPAEAVNELFAPASESPVSLVRIAAHCSEVEECAPAIRALSGLGYRVGLNLMQATTQPLEMLEGKAAFLSDLPVSVLYFADSFGNMSPDDIDAIVGAFRGHWSGPIGVHTHDNMGNALGNSMRAHECGCTWVDSTVLGMGRGAGNLRTETALLELDRRGIRASTGIDDLLNLVVDDFSQLQRNYGWGPSIFYHLSALYNVHPTYVQEMLTGDRYTQTEIVSTLKRLGGLDARNFCPRILRDAAAPEVPDNEGTSTASHLLSNRTVLIVGAGEQGREHLEGLLQFIKAHKPYVISLNWNTWLPSEYVDAWSACTPERLLLENDLYSRHKGTLVVPRPLVPSEMRPALRDWHVVDYGMKVESQRFDSTPRTAVIPFPLALLYALAFVNAANAGRVLLAGIDGHAESDPRRHDLDQALRLYLENASHRPLVSVTPTSLSSIRQSSVYAPWAGFDHEPDVSLSSRAGRHG